MLKKHFKNAHCEFMNNFHVGNVCFPFKALEWNADRIQSLSESRKGSKVTKPIFSNSRKRYSDVHNVNTITFGLIENSKHFCFGRCRLVPENFCVFLPNQKPEWPWPFGTGLVRHCPQGLFSTSFTFLRAIFSRPFRLSLAPTICPWVSEDGRNLGLWQITLTVL